MLKEMRKQIINNLWLTYHQHTPHIKQVQSALRKKNIVNFPLDHFAIIDLPSKHSGIPTLKKIFESIGFTKQGTGYLPEKQNDFLWLAENNCENALATEVLPQAVVADFRPDEMPVTIRDIIIKYATFTTKLPDNFDKLAEKAKIDSASREQLTKSILNYLSGRDWPAPTIREFETVKQFNELLAWVLVFGRRVNHFTISVHLLPDFNSLETFQDFIVTDAGLALNQEGGSIKGGSVTGISQGSTKGIIEKIILSDGEAHLPTGFVEFVWRYPNSQPNRPPVYWADYFTGFIANHANRVIESLYVQG